MEGSRWSRAKEVRRLHRILSQKCRQHSAAIKSIWISLDQTQRAQCMKDCAWDGTVLLHPLDTSRGSNVHKVIPEWNLRDVTVNPDIFLEMLEYRATNPLVEQYKRGFDGGFGDHAFIINSDLGRGVDIDPCAFSIFLPDDPDGYGSSVIVKNENIYTTPLAPGVRAGFIVPESIGELILMRQQYYLRELSSMVDRILDKEASSISDCRTTPPVSSLTLDDFASSKLAELILLAQEQHASSQDHLHLLNTNPYVLTHDASKFFSTQPELVPDEKGRHLPSNTDKHISEALFNSIHTAVQAASIWSYLARLLETLGKTDTADKASRSVLLQEVSNVCNLQYSRAKCLLRRGIQTDRDGIKWFRRMSNQYDKSGNPRVVMKGDAKSLEKLQDLQWSDTRLYYLLRLCQTETAPRKAADWLRKLLADESKPWNNSDGCCTLDEMRVNAALYELAIIVGLILDLQEVHHLPLPPPSKKKGTFFISEFEQVESEVNHIRNIFKFSSPVSIDDLMQVDVAEKVLGQLGREVTDQTRATLEYLYHDLVADCLSHVVSVECDETNLEMTEDEKKSVSELSKEKVIQDRRRKKKAERVENNDRVYEVLASSQAAAVEPEIGPAGLQKRIKVSKKTAEIFKALFFFSKTDDDPESSQSQEEKIKWTDFLADMIELGFLIRRETRFGFVYRLYSPVRKEFVTLQKPPGKDEETEIGRYFGVVVARRLEKVYGWSGDTFEVV
ncbi:hypothetical protein QBC43DRAFT_288977 [Cladorrhinum sp. PSN259]|nr:hypothetical protein QBC43DRAFT_288977 [Cladorrhinum sp. PSN259]